LKDNITIYQLTTIAAAIAFFVPLVIVAAKKVLRDNLITWFAIFWGWAGFINLIFVSSIIQNTQITYAIERVYNLSDAPFMLFVLYKTTYVEAVKKSLKKILIPFLLFEFFYTGITGLKGAYEGIIIAIGVAVVLFYISWIILFHMRGIKQNNFQYAMQFIYYALLFEYGVSIITFIYSYIMPDKVSSNDNFLIFHLGVIITIATASYGMAIYTEKLPEKKKKRRITEREAEIRFL
jgi:hypothetical protein